MVHLLFISGLENRLRFFESSPIDRKCTHYSAIADDKLVTIISSVKMREPLQEVRCVLRLRNFNQSRMYSGLFEQNGMSLLAYLINLSELLQNKSHTRSTVSPITKAQGYLPV
ncbi:hypothetical protein TNCV_4046511 [Trichonephila clavipes]|nr:hypothetical protein TNCV_4046511 [Trichonephila clavipes]